MQQSTLKFGHKSNFAPLLSMTHPNKEFFQRHRALLPNNTPSNGTTFSDNHLAHEPRLNQHFIQHKESTFFMRFAGNSMCGLGIFDGDLLAVDRSATAENGCVVIAAVHGELTVKQLLYTAAGCILRAAHPSYADIVITSEHELTIWGVVQWNVHKT